MKRGNIPFGRLSKRCRWVGPLRSSPAPAPLVLNLSIRIGKTCGRRVWLSGWKSRRKAKNRIDRSISSPVFSETKVRCSALDNGAEIDGRVALEMLDEQLADAARIST